MSVIKLTRRSSAAAMAPVVTSGLPFYGSWPEASGEWPSPWQKVAVNDDTTVSQNSGSGLMTRTANGFTAMYPQTAAAQDVDVLIKMSHGGLSSINGNCRFDILLRWGGGMGVGSNSQEPAGCLDVKLQLYRSGTTTSRSLTVYTRDASGLGTALFTVVPTPPSNSEYWFRIELVGSRLRFKQWSASDSEPITWLYEEEHIDYDVIAGYAAVAYGSTSGSNQPAISVHSFALTAPSVA